MDKYSQIADEVSMIMPKIARRVLMDFFQHVEIPQTQLFAIIILYERGQARLSDLSQEMHIAAPTVTGIVDRLEQSGYVRREPDVNDRRVINIQLTEEGIKIGKKLHKTIQARWHEILSHLSIQDAQMYLELLKKIKGSLDQ